MGLVVWLPLNGNLNNQGLSNVTVTNNGATVDDNGKIGKCMKVVSSTLLGYTPDFNTKSISLCGWFKFNRQEIKDKVSTLSFTDSSTTPTGNLIGNSSYGGIGIIWRGNNYYSSGDFTSMEVFGYIRTATGSKSTSSFSVDFDTWIHIALVWDVSTRTFSLYKNGVILNSQTVVAFSDGVSRELRLDYSAVFGGNGPGCSIPMRCNDVRIYDHCLSPKEVKELSRGLVLHYKLDDWAIARSKCSNITWNQLVQNGGFENNTAWLSYNPNIDSISIANNECTVTILDVKNDIYSNTVKQPMPTCIVGHKYLQYYDIYVPKACLTYAGYYGTYGISKGIDMGWNHIVEIYTATLNASMMYVGIGKASTYGYQVNDTFKVKNVGVFDLTQMFGAGNEPTLEEFELMFPLPYYPYDAGTVKDLTLPLTDCSGYNYNGTITGTLSLDSNTPRYEYSTLYNGTTYIYRTPLECSSEIKTISFWASWNYIPSGQSVLFVDNGTKTGFGLMSTGILLTTSAAGSSYTYSKSSLVANTWYHFVIIITGTTTRDLYINGIKQIATSNTSNWTYSVNQLQIGKRSTTSDGFVGKMCDFRMYSTNLSDQDILNLYHNSASIDKNSNMYTFEYKETYNNSVKVKKNGTTENYSIVEDNTITNASFSKTGTIKAKTFYEK